MGELDACGVCNGPGEIYECGCSDIPAGDCDCDGNQLDALGVCGGGCPADENGDGICDTEVIGCTDESACNYDASTTIADNSLCPTQTSGHRKVLVPSMSADVLTSLLEIATVTATKKTLSACVAATAADADNDGLCDDIDECVGQLDAIGVCNGTCTSDTDGDGICDDDVDNGLDCNHDTDDDGIVDCQDPCPYGDFDDDGICDAIDPCVGVIDILGICNGHCFVNDDNDQICDDVDNCIDTDACNYADPANGTCLYLDECGNCGGTDYAVAPTQVPATMTLTLDVTMVHALAPTSVVCVLAALPAQEPSSNVAVPTSLLETATAKAISLTSAETAVARPTPVAPTKWLATTTRTQDVRSRTHVNT